MAVLDGKESLEQMVENDHLNRSDCSEHFHNVSQDKRRTLFAFRIRLCLVTRRCRNGAELVRGLRRLTRLIAHAVAEGAEGLLDPVELRALNFERVVFDRAAGTAGVLQLGQQFGEVIVGGG